MDLKISIIGHFGIGKNNFLDGQTIKTKILYGELKKKVGENNVFTIDTHNCKKKPLNFIKNIILVSRKSNAVIIITSVRGRNVLIPLCYLLKRLFSIKVYCMVIGGGFPQQMRKNKVVSLFAKGIDKIFVETNTMLNELRNMGYKNAFQLNNFKNLIIEKHENLKYEITFPLKICTFSRVIKEKGIEDIIKAVMEINKKHKNIIYELDIYGQVGDRYKEEFNRISKGFPRFINYKDVINYDESVSVIKNYFLLIFPTLYRTEGVPGTIIDAYAAGVPVIASNWDSCNDVIDNGKTGLIYNMGNINDLVNKLESAYFQSDKILAMKANCLNKAKEYMSERVISELLEHLILIS